MREATSATASRGDATYRTLKALLLDGAFPLNVRLGEERLATQLGVSRTPVREAMKRLFAEGLVVPHPDGGFQPWVPQVSTMRDLYEARSGLELQALLRPGHHGTRHDAARLGELRDRWQALADGPPPEPDPNFVLLDEDFHVQLATAAGNHVLVEMLQQVNDRIRLVRMQDFLTQERIDATIAEHLELVGLVLDGDIVTAEARFVHHLAHSMAVVEQRVQTALARMLMGGRR